MQLLGLVLATILSYPLGLVAGSAWLLPALNALPAYLVMVHRLRSGDRRGAVVAVLVWAATMTVAGTVFFALWPTRPDHTVLSGPAYRDEMFAWIATGVGREGSLRLFLPQHLVHLAVFVVLTLATAGAASILVGAVLMNFMDFYVASLFRAGAPIGHVIAFGWQPWALCRVAAFAILGAVLSEPLLSRLRPYAYQGLRAARRYLAFAGVLILADWVMKATLAPIWGRVLRGVLRFGAP